MPSRFFKHIFLSEIAERMSFTNPRFGGNVFKVNRKNRRQQSTLLRNSIEETWRQFETERDRLHTERQGEYFEFVSDPGFELSIQSLDSIRSGIRLLNTRVEDENNLKVMYATVYIPYKKRGYFLKKIKAYADEVDNRSRKPKNIKLINNIAEIRKAVLESFWKAEEREYIPGVKSDWVEIWLSSDKEEDRDGFSQLLKSLGIESAAGDLVFPERTIKLVRTNREQLINIIAHTDSIAECRAARIIPGIILQMSNKDQVELVEELRERSVIRPSDVYVCILDTGVNNGHSLLQPLLDNADLLTVKPEWNTDDQEGHGTLMAGAAAYGDVYYWLNNRSAIMINHRLESVKILPLSNNNPKHLWGYITSQGIYIAEINGPQRKRIYCMAVTAKDYRDRGHPSSWSAAMDNLSYGDGENTRCIIISAGNVNDPDNWRNYPDDNLTNEVHDPAQAWNVLTVGACTEKNVIRDMSLSGYSPVAPQGGLSPYSTTSTTWARRKWPIKPEIVFEGGNVAKGPNDSIIDADELKLLSTYRDPQVAQFAPFCATSAASAQLSRFAAQIKLLYPEAWPETIRALIVHSAEWTDAMIGQFLGQSPNRNDYAGLLRICGYGVPSLERALYCLSNSLTLISQASLQPYEKRDGRYVTRDMHLYNLPWPREELIGLGEADVKMRVTLSYYIEPGPGEVGWDYRYRYASHALRFEVNGPGESEDDFKQRINRQARNEDEHPGTIGPAERWKFGDSRNVGSIHSDIWEGRAADLANSNLIAVFPVIGWWRERSYLNKWDSRCRYSLIVSVYTQSQDIDIYTPVAIKIGIVNPITINT